MIYYLLNHYIPNVLKSVNIGLGKCAVPKLSPYLGTFLHSNIDCGHLAHAGQGGHDSVLSFIHVCCRFSLTLLLTDVKLF